MSGKRFYLKFKDITIGTFIEKPSEDLHYVPHLTNAMTLPLPIGFPLGLYPASNDPQVVESSKPTSEEIYKWLHERILPQDRQGAFRMLLSLNMSKYDIWEISKLTKAINFNDYYWITDNDHDKFSTIHPQAKVESINLLAGARLRHSALSKRKLQKVYSARKIRKMQKDSRSKIAPMQLITPAKGHE